MKASLLAGLHPHTPTVPGMCPGLHHGHAWVHALDRCGCASRGPEVAVVQYQEQPLLFVEVVSDLRLCNMPQVVVSCLTLGS